MGPRNRTPRRLQTQGLQGLPPVTHRTGRTRQMARRTTRERIHTPIEITDGLPLFLRREEGRQTTTYPGLSTSELRNKKEQVPPTAYPRTHRPTQREEILHETRCTMGIQQYPNQGRRRMESRLQDEPRPLRTNGHVLWTHQLPRDIPEHDERPIQRTDRQWISRNLPQRHTHRSRLARRTTKRDRQGPRNTREQRPLPQTREVRIRTRKNRIPRGHHLERTRQDGPSESRRNHR